MPKQPFLQLISRHLDELMHRPEAVVRDAPGAGVVVALSGGPDSVALLLAVRAWGEASGRPVAAAHLNHRLRGREADHDALFCRELCAALAVPLFEHAADPRPLARQRGLGLEEAGRHLRREFCEGILVAEESYRWLAAGHHRDDQTETVLMRVFRGTGPDGLGGIKPVAGAWLHPLLAVGRADILAFLDEAGQPWRTDGTNLDGDNVRARLRRELLPVARDIFGAGSADGPARLADLLADDLDLLAALTADWLAACRNNDGTLQVDNLLGLPTAVRRRVLRAWLMALGVTDLELVHVRNIMSWLQEGRSDSVLDLPGPARLRREFDRLSLSREAPSGVPLRQAGDYRVVVAGGPAAPDGAELGHGEPDNESTWQVTGPAGCLHGNLQVRNWRAGDRFQPFGLQGTKKLSDLLREHQVPRAERGGVLVVADAEGILWVVGLARSERMRMLPDTSRTVTISVVKRTGSDRGPGSNQTREYN